LDVDFKAIIFWDDDPENTEIAKEVGIGAYTYKDFGEFVRKLDELLPDEMKDIMAFDTEDIYCDLVFSGKVWKVLLQPCPSLIGYPTRTVKSPCSSVSMLYGRTMLTRIRCLSRSSVLTREVKVICP